MSRVAGSWTGFGMVISELVAVFGWLRVIVLAEVTPGSCSYGAKSIDERMHTLTESGMDVQFVWVQLSSEPTDDEINAVLKQIANDFRGKQRDIIGIFPRVDLGCVAYW